MKIKVEQAYMPCAPGPKWRNRWLAIDDDTYDEGKPIGEGDTKEEAIANLLTQLEESEDWLEHRRLERERWHR